MSVIHTDERALRPWDMRTLGRTQMGWTEIEHVEVLDGRGVTFEMPIVHGHDSVHVVALDPEGRLYLVRQWRAAMRRVATEVIAGSIGDKGPEEVAECARRELAEEAFASAAQMRLLGSFPKSPGSTPSLMHVFLATGVRHDPAAAADEPLEVILVTPDEAKAIFRREGVDAMTALSLSLAGVPAVPGP